MRRWGPLRAAVSGFWLELRLDLLRCSLAQSAQLLPRATAFAAYNCRYPVPVQKTRGQQLKGTHCEALSVVAEGAQRCRESAL